MANRVKLGSIETLIVDLPTIRPHALAMVTMNAQSIVIVRIRDTDGATGIGEGTTIGGLSYGEESPEGIKLAIDTYIAPLLANHDLAKVGATMADIDRHARRRPATRVPSPAPSTGGPSRTMESCSRSRMARPVAIPRVSTPKARTTLPGSLVSSRTGASCSAVSRTT